MPELAQGQTVWQQLKMAPAAAESGKSWLHFHPGQLDQSLVGRNAHPVDPLDNQELALLAEANRAWGADAATLAAVESLGNSRTRVIVAGQQPGLMAGPLLVIYKTIGAIALCLQMKERFQEHDWVPVFWVASEDHDFDEIRRVFWVGHSGQLEEYLLGQQVWQPGQMIGRVPVETMLRPLLEQIERSIYKSEHHSEVLGLIREVCAEGSNLEASFARLMHRLFSGTGLVLVSPLMDWVRRRSAPIFQKELRSMGQTSARIMVRGEAMRNAGFEPTVHRPPNSINCFWLDDQGRRHSLRHQGDAIIRSLSNGQGQGNGDDHSELPPLTPLELDMIAIEHPEQLSGNVVTRPLIQDAILPTVAQVIGPGEAAYLAQVEAVYEDFGVFRPVRYPRPQVTLLEPRVLRNMEKYSIAQDQALALDTQELAGILVRRDLQSGALQEIEALHRRHLEELEGLKAKVNDASNPAIDSSFQKLSQMMNKGYETLSERMLYQHQQDDRHLGQAMALIGNSLRPNSQPQERLLNPIIPFAIQYGLDWVLRLMPLIQTGWQLDQQVVSLGDLSSKPPAQN